MSVSCWYLEPQLVFQISTSGIEPMPLSDLQCRNARPTKKLQKLSDGGGLQRWVQSTGGRLWRLAYRFEGKQKLLALGPTLLSPSPTPGDARFRQDIGVA
jgi:hypothetical protein